MEIVKSLKFDTDTTIFTDTDGTVMYIRRPSKLSKRFSAYDVNKNFQIWFKTSEKAFRPNHLRLLMDLYMRGRSRPDLKRKLLLAFDNIFYGKDVDDELKELAKEKFEHTLNSLQLIGHLTQAFFVEQEYAYNKESNYIPPSLWLLGWIRQAIASPAEIDLLLMSIPSGRPPDKNCESLQPRKYHCPSSNNIIATYLNASLRGYLNFLEINISPERDAEISFMSPLTY